MKYRKRMEKILIYISGGYVIILLYTVLFQKKIIFWNKPLLLDYQYSFKYPFQEIWLRPDSTTRLNALYFNAVSTIPKRGVVLYFHGNADNLVRWGKYAPDFTKNGYDVLMIDYPSYGKSVGEMTEEACHSHAQFVYDYASKTFSKEQIVIYGRSLGTGIATRLATVREAKMLLLETPYLSLPAVGKSHFPLLPYKQMIDFKFYTDQCIWQVKCPIHIFHGTADELIPYSHAVKLCQIVGQLPNVMLTTIPDGKHKNLGEFPAYHAALDSCLSR
jgi:uncharacterized protein